MDTSTSEDVPPASRGKRSQSFELAGIKSEPGSDEVTAHVLCDSCTRLITKSRIIQEFMGTAEPEDAYTIWKRLRGGPRTESFSRSHALPSIAEFEASTACHLCSIIWHSLPRDAVEHGCGFLDATVAEDRSVDYVPVTFEVAASHRVGKRSATSSGAYGPWNVCVMLKRYRGPLYPAGTSGSGPFLSLTSGSEESLATARFWLNDCLKDHSECRMRSAGQATGSPSKLPTRLIHVGEAQGQLTARLVLPTASASLEDIPYLTLSHSWSITTKEASLKLKTENIQQLQESIPLKDLSGTFRDAMDMTRRLGYRYIWIDSLCIIQDSHEDWEKEAVTMCDVYGNSTCTISALGTGGLDRCYVQRNPLPLFPCRVSMAADRIPVYATSLDWTWDFDKMDKDSPLFQRGWVMQERLLSSRVIITGHHQLYWECCHFRTNESFTFAFGSGPIITHSPKLTFHALCDPQYRATDVAGVADLANMSLDCNMLGLYSLWLKLVIRYMRMKLTYQTDKLVALTGIVNAVQNSRRWTSVAGMWKEFWPLDMLWFRAFDEQSEKFTRIGLGLPSWSWASTEEPKIFFNVFDYFKLEDEERGRLVENQVKEAKGKKGDSLRTYNIAKLICFWDVRFSLQHSRSAIAPAITLVVQGMVWRAYVQPRHPSNSSVEPHTVTHGPDGYHSFCGSLKWYWSERPSTKQVVYLLPLITMIGWHFEQQCGLILVPVTVDDTGNIKDVPQVSWQSDFPGRLKDAGTCTILSSLRSYSVWKMNPKKSGSIAEPTHYRRIGAFYLSEHPDCMGQNIFGGVRGLHQRTVHIV